MNEFVLEKAIDLADKYSYQIDSYADFGSDLWFVDLERNRRYEKISETEYEKMNLLAHSLHISKDGKKKLVDVKDYDSLLKVVNSNSAYDEKTPYEQLNSIKGKAAEYSKRINAYEDFGSDLWFVCLERNLRNKIITDEEHKEIENFAKENLDIAGTGQNAIDIRWGRLCRWAEEVSSEYSFLYGKKLNPENYTLFKKTLNEERHKGKLSDRDYIVLSLAFSDTDKYIEECKQKAKDEVEYEIKMEEKEQRAKGRSLWIFFLFQLAVVALFCFVSGGLIGIGIWALCGTIVLPLQLIIGSKVSRKIAEATVFDPSDIPSDEYTASMDSAEVGIIAGSIHAGIGCANELRKPGWIKDSK